MKNLAAVFGTLLAIVLICIFTGLVQVPVSIEFGDEITAPAGSDKAIALPAAGPSPQVGGLPWSAALEQVYAASEDTPVIRADSGIEEYRMGVACYAAKLGPSEYLIRVEATASECAYLDERRSRAEWDAPYPGAASVAPRGP